MRVKTNVKAGAISKNHNQTVKGLRVKSNVKAGALTRNHNQTVKGLRVKSSVKAGWKGLCTGCSTGGSNHNQTIARAIRVKSGVKAGGYNRQHNQAVVRVTK